MRQPAVYCLIGGIFAFFLIAALEVKGRTQSWDDRILVATRELAARKDRPGRLWGEESVIAITSLGAQVVLVGLSCAVIGVLWLTRRLGFALLIVFAFLGAIAFNHWLKLWFARPRPTSVSHLQFVETASFPSGHALISTTVYVILGMIGAALIRDPRLKRYIVALAAGLSLIVGLSRVYLGVHYPSDVLGGWALGISWAALCWLGGSRLLCAEGRFGQTRIEDQPLP